MCLPLVRRRYARRAALHWEHVDGRLSCSEKTTKTQEGANCHRRRSPAVLRKENTSKRTQNNVTSLTSVFVIYLYHRHHSRRGHLPNSALCRCSSGPVWATGACSYTRCRDYGGWGRGAPASYTLKPTNMDIHTKHEAEQNQWNMKYESNMVPI